MPLDECNLMAKRGCPSSLASFRGEDAISDLHVQCLHSKTVAERSSTSYRSACQFTLTQVLQRGSHHLTHQTLVLWVYERGAFPLADVRSAATKSRVAGGINASEGVVQRLKAAKNAQKPATESSAVATISAQCATYTRLGLVFQVQTFGVLSSSSPLSRA